MVTGKGLLSGAEEDRTPDLCIANAALTQLSYRPKQAKTNDLITTSIRFGSYLFGGSEVLL